MKLDQFKKDFSSRNLQYLSINRDGLVIECQPSFLPIKKGDPIITFHPFFECLPTLQELPENEFSFFCVHLEIAKSVYITDIHIKRKGEDLLLLIQNQTEHYNSYQIVAQSRNQAVINEELIFIKNSELEQRERFKNLFIQNFSHELRNPLMTSMAIAQILGNTNLNTEQRQLLSVLSDSNDQLKLLLEDTLSIAMIASGKLEIKSLPFDLGKLLELLDFTYKTKCKSKGLLFDLEIDERVPLMVEGDRLRLFQVLSNLLDNAVKYTTTGTVSLHLGLNQQWAGKAHVRFAVTDTGPGIPPDKQEVIFESFSQLENPIKSRGSGLGLAIVKGILDLMDSKIQLISEKGQRTTFSFNLGLKIPLKSRLALSVSDYSKVAYDKLGISGKKYKLLIVEDDERLLTVLFKMIMDTKRFYIDVLNDGSQVLESIVQNQFDIVLMDINLPNTKGDQLTRLIREFPFKNIRTLPIIGMTANAYEDQLKTYKEAGMNAILSKPFEQDDLIYTLFAAL